MGKDYTVWDLSVGDMLESNSALSRGSVNWFYLVLLPSNTTCKWGGEQHCRDGARGIKILNVVIFFSRKLDRIPMSTSFPFLPLSPTLFNMDGCPLFWSAMKFLFWNLKIQYFPNATAFWSGILAPHSNERTRRQSMGSSYLISAAHYRWKKLSESDRLSGPGFSHL